MHTRERLIRFQNQAEENFQNKKNLSTSSRYLLALVVFFLSTLLAAFTWPVRALTKMLTLQKTSTQIRKMNADNMESILKKERLVLIDFWAEWCGPCLMMQPVLEEFAASSPNVTVAKVNADTNRTVVNKFNIRGLPQFVLLQDGQEVKRHAGPMTRSELKAFCGE